MSLQKISDVPTSRHDESMTQFTRRAIILEAEQSSSTFKEGKHYITAAVSKSDDIDNVDTFDDEMMMMIMMIKCL